jgi:hypothetical protein
MQFTCNAVNTHLRAPALYCSCSATESPFDSVVFHFDDFNYGRRSQPYFFLTIAAQLGFFHILIANPIDWLFAACLEYFIFLSIDSSGARKQYDEYCPINVIADDEFKINLYEIYFLND